MQRLLRVRREGVLNTAVLRNLDALMGPPRQDQQREPLPGRDLMAGPRARGARARPCLQDGKADFRVLVQRLAYRARHLAERFRSVPSTRAKARKERPDLLKAIPEIFFLDGATFRVQRGGTSEQPLLQWQKVRPKESKLCMRDVPAKHAKQP